MANVKISDLTAAAAATSTQQFEVNDSGASKSVTGDQIKAFVKAGFVASDITDLTVTAAELNILDGVTATAAEINKLDGLLATTAELNFVDGVTSAIQTQLDAKAPLASPTFTGTLNVTGNVAATTSIDCGTQFLGQSADNAAAPSFSWTGDEDAGMYRVGANVIGFSTGGVERLRIASAGQIGIGGASYGSSGQVLTSNGSGAAPSWQTPSSDGTVLLGTMTTTSGTAQTLSGLSLGAYRFLVLVFNNVSSNTGTSVLKFGSTTGTTLSDSISSSGNTFKGHLWIDIASGSSVSSIGTITATTYTPDLAVSASTTSITIALSVGSFDAGSIRVYGVI